MNINRREFLKRGGLLAAFSALPKAVTVGVDAAREHVLKVYHKHVTIPVGIPVFGKRTGIPFVDWVSSIDYPGQRLACNCEYSLDGECLHACDEAEGLMNALADKAADFWAAVAEHVDPGSREFLRLKVMWRVYMAAEKEYRRHYCTGWVEGNEHA